MVAARPGERDAGLGRGARRDGDGGLSPGPLVTRSGPGGF